MSNITLWGAVYDTDYVDLPKTGGGTVRFSEGEPSALTTKTITLNGSYSAEDDSADGYSAVTVNVQGGASMTEVANTYGTELVITSAPGSAPSATRHTLYFEFEDETTATVYAYYDSAFIGNAITATTPTTYDSKTVTSAQLDGVEWYSFTPTPTPSGNWTTIYDGTLQTQNGMDIISELSDWYFTDGKQYRVTIDGTPYTCTAETNETGAVLIGNFNLYNDITAEGDYPFLCFNIGWGGVYVYLQNGGNTTHSFKLEEEQTSA